MSKKKSNEPVVIEHAGDLPPMPASLGSMGVNKTASWRSMRPIIIEAKCKRCMLCWKFCPEPAIRAGDPPVVDYDYCKGCGICIVECPFGAIETEKEGR
jgi:2-oxoisovalerate ferredoxin oxidoreductase delta subunit